MKRLLLICLLAIASKPLAAQNVNGAIQRDFSSYSKLVSERKIDQSLEYINPKLFELFPKDQMKSLLEAVYKLPNIEYKLGIPAITGFGEPKLVDGASYVKLEIVSPLEMKFKDMELDDESLAGMTKSFEAKFGEGNVSFDKTTGFFKVKAKKQVIASSTDKGENWKFVTVDNPKMKALLSKIIPAELLE
ncbi:MAG: hypothetical protein REI78_14760 [Pedobacter sp.]|nr:hypothetical protein [Pedobacter sp.]